MALKYLPERAISFIVKIVYEVILTKHVPSIWITPT